MIWSCGKIRDEQLWAQAPPAQDVVELLGFALDTEKMHITPPTTIPWNLVLFLTDVVSLHAPTC
jgi:hypothetical protein